MKLLAVEDDPRLLRNLARVFREEGYAVDTAEDGEVGLYLAENGTYDAIVLDVMLPRLDRFYLADKSRSRAEGCYGLGLSICKAIVESHGGSIEAESQLEVGTTVRILLPSAPAER